MELRLFHRRLGRREFIGAGAVVAGGATLGGSWLLDRSGPSPLGPLDGRRAEVGAPAPRFALADARGGARVELPRPGRAALLSFSATWCLTCVAELRNLQAVEAEFAPAADLVVVNFQQEREAVLNLLDRLNVPDVRVVLDGAGAVTRSYRVNELPALALVDSAGVVRELSNAFLSPSVIRELLGRVGSV